MSEVAATSPIRRKYLVVVDETPECDRAVTFAACRVLRSGGTVVLLSVIAPPDFHGLGVEDVLRAEAIEAAEANLNRRIARIADLGSIRVETSVREGRPAEAIEQMIQDDPSIAILVLASSGAAEGPGPLVQHFATRVVLPIPMTIVPGSLSDEQIMAIC